MLFILFHTFLAISGREGYTAGSHVVALSEGCPFDTEGEDLAESGKAHAGSLRRQHALRSGQLAILCAKEPRGVEPVDAAPRIRHGGRVAYTPDAGRKRRNAKCADRMCAPKERAVAGRFDRLRPFGSDSRLSSGNHLFLPFVVDYVI
jgi:hypothetical protein